jgi:hypothetical protein
MAVRHGWVSGGETLEAPPAEAKSDIDVPAFIASVLTPAADGYHVPAGWVLDLDGLPGFDRATRTVRLTDDPEQLRDTRGRELLYPGRSHPLTRRAIASVRTGQVSTAIADRLSLLLTFTAEIGSLLRRVFALRLYPDGSIEEHDDPLALAKHPATRDDLWSRSFAGWVPSAITAARSEAASIADRLASTFALEQQERVRRDTTALRAWLERRSTELCGTLQPWVGDLFDTGPAPGDWHSCPVPEQRLSGFMTDSLVAMPQRREAANVLARFQSITANRSPPPLSSVRMLGMLMLIP